MVFAFVKRASSEFHELVHTEPQGNPKYEFRFQGLGKRLYTHAHGQLRLVFVARHAGRVTFLLI